MNTEQQSYADLVNRNLKVGGTNLLGQPLYRIIWSDNELEKRIGTFKDYFGGIFIREVREARLVPKYNYISERWVLERWIPPELCYNPELPDSQWGSFEPIYVFQDKYGKALPFSERVVHFIINLAEKQTKITPEERKAEYDAKEEKEIQEYIESLEISPITNALHMKEAIGYQGPKKEN